MYRKKQHDLIFSEKYFSIFAKNNTYPMKNAVHSLLLRSIIAFMLGVILILWSGDALLILVISVGILFIILGFIPLVLYFFRNLKKFPDISFPHLGLCFLIFGIILVIAPALFVNILMYLLGIILVLGGIEQIYTLIRARKWTKVPAVFYLLPVLILIAGILVLCNPFKTAENIFILAGITSLIYGIAELINWIKFRK